MNQTWLGIDPGLATIGWAFLVKSEETEARLLEYGTIETASFKKGVFWVTNAGEIKPSYNLA